MTRKTVIQKTATFVLVSCTGNILVSLFNEKLNLICTIAKMAITNGGSSSGLYVPPGVKRIGEGVRKLT